MKCFISNSVLAAGLMLLSVASYGQTPITSVPYTITAPGTHIFAKKLTYWAASGNAITVNAHDVSIDLNGYYLYCPTPNNSANGIFASNKANLQVRNGAIVGFNHGVDLEGGTDTFASVVDGIRFWQNHCAIWFNQSTGCAVQNCHIIGGFVGVLFFNGSGNQATNNVASGLTYGFASQGTDYFDSNYADKCSFGIWASSATTKFRFNTTTNCTTPVTGGTEEFAGDQ